MITRMAGICLRLAGIYILTFALFAVVAHADPLGSVIGNCAVLAGTSVTNTNNSVISGGLCVGPIGAAISGFPPGLVNNGVINNNNLVATQARLDTITAYNAFNLLGPGKDLTGQDLGGMTLTDGVYSFSSSAQLTGALTLNFQGLNNANFYFLIGSTLTTASASSVLMENLGKNDNIYWVVGSSATLGSSTSFA